MHRICKKVITIAILFLTVFLGNTYVFGERAESPKTLGLYNGNSRETGYYTVSKTEGGTLPVIKIVEYKSNESAQDMNKADQVIYCLRDGIGFGASAGNIAVVSSRTQNYENYFDMRKEIDEKYKSALPSDQEYPKLMWLLDNICDPNNQTSVDKLLKEASIDKEEFADLLEQKTDFKDVIEVVQQSAIWYITNKTVNAQYRPAQTPMFYVADDESYQGNNQNVDTKYNMEEINSAISKLYKYLIEEAESNENYDYTQTSTAASINKLNAKAFKENDCFYIGPYSITGTASTITNASITVTGGLSNLAKLVDSDKSTELEGEDITDKLKKFSGENFYIELPLSEHGKEVTIQITSECIKRNITYWTTTENNLSETQPVAIIEDKTEETSDNDTEKLPELISVSVEKQWEDEDNRDHIRPAQITVKLKAKNTSEVEDQTAELTDGHWKHTFENLLKRDSEGTEIQYEVEELKNSNDGLSKYESSISGDMQQGYTVTNSYTPEKFDVKVTKEWEDGDNRDGLEEDVQVELLQNEEPMSPPQIATLNKPDWTHTFRDLYKYDEEGHEITYSVKETTTIDGYEVTYSELTVGSEDNTYELTVTNTHDPDKIDIPVTKVWYDNGEESLRGDIEVQLYADDEPVEEGGTLTLNKNSEWKGTFRDLYKYKDGQLITYSVQETNTPEGYKASIKQNNESDVTEGFTITNTYEQDKIEIPVTKVWVDNDEESLRGDIEVQLYADDEPVEGGTLTLNKDSEWKGTFRDLYRYKDGQLITYSVQETKAPEGYKASIKQNNENDVTEGFTITNTYEPDKIEIPVTKVWVDNGDESLRKDIEVQLYANDEPVDGETLTLNEDSDWGVHLQIYINIKMVNQ